MAGPLVGEAAQAWLAKPMSYMNRSGEPLARLLLDKTIETPRLLVACDDVNLPLGTLRLRARGSSGGHNGLRSIEARLGDGYGRLRLGVGSERAGDDLVGFVLGEFEKDELEGVREMLDRAEAMLLQVLREGLRPSTSQPAVES